MIKKSCFLLFIFLSFYQFAKGQHPTVRDTIISANIQKTHTVKNEETNRLFLLYLYDKYRDHIVYKNAPFKGLSFDMDRPLFQSRLINQVAFGLGAFTWNFKQTGQKKVSGLLLGHPIYMGWEFTLYNQFRFTAGTTLLEQRYRSDYSQKTVLLNSFIGLSGKFPLSIKKKQLLEITN